MKHEHEKTPIMHELTEHIPFTAIAVAATIAIMAILILNSNILQYTLGLFEFFHPAHIFFSAIVSAAIFYKYKKNILLALISSMIISVIIGSVSDIIFPYLGSLLFNLQTSFHLEALEEPIIIFGTAFFGAIVGISTRYTKFPHFLHVFISLFASLLYILAYSSNFTSINYFFIFIITTISVVVPCCMSDIVFPILFQGRRK